MWQKTVRSLGHTKIALKKYLVEAFDGATIKKRIADDGVEMQDQIENKHVWSMGHHNNNCTRWDRKKWTQWVTPKKYYKQRYFYYNKMR